MTTLTPSRQRADTPDAASARDRAALTPSPSRARRTGRPRSGAWPSRIGPVLLAGVLTLAGLGAALAALLLVRADSTSVSRETVIETPSGTLGVGALSVLVQSDPKDMVGMPEDAHEPVSGLKAQLPVTLTNRSGVPLAYSPDQFALLTVDGISSPTTEAPDAGMQTLRPGAAITMRLTFSASSLEQPRLQYSPASGDPVVTVLAPTRAASDSPDHTGHYGPPAPAVPAKQDPDPAGGQEPAGDGHTDHSH